MSDVTDVDQVEWRTVGVAVARSLLFTEGADIGHKNDRFVSPRPDGTWANQRVGADRAASIHKTQQEAIDAARRNLHHAGGGELNVQRPDGRIRLKDTVPPGHDPCPPRDMGG